MVDAHIVTGFAHGQQLLSPGVIVRVPMAQAQSWVAAGLATLPGQPQVSPSEPAKPASTPKPRTKKAA